MWYVQTLILIIVEPSFFLRNGMGRGGGRPVEPIAPIVTQDHVFYLLLSLYTMPYFWFLKVVLAKDDLCISKR
jgi:hypothetical protein